jgi:hypothetical protein
VRWLGTAIALVVTASAASARAQPAPKGGAAPAREEEADPPDADGYGGTGWLDRVSKGTEEIEQCRPRSGTDDKELKRRKSDHYDRGVVLYEQGDYQGAIREFVTAYCDSPESSMFYNIGQAYERMLDYEKAVAYLERFILESAPEAPNRKRAEIRVDVLRRTPARILVATSPKGAEVTLSSETGVSARARANSDVPIEVRKGTYTIRVESPGHEPHEQKIVAEIGRPYSYYFQLEPKKSLLRVVASPSDARIFLGDRMVGIGSYAERVPVGKYKLLVEAEDRPSERREIEVAVGRTSDVTVGLKQKPRSGRWELILASGLLLGSAAGGTVGALFDQEPAVSFLVGVGGLGSGFGGAYLGVPDDIPVGTSSYLIGSTLIGFAEGAAIASLFVCDEKTVTEIDEDGNEKTRASLDCDKGVEEINGASLAGAAAGGAFAALTTSRFDLSAGDAALINSAGMWGTASGVLFWASFDREPSVFGPMILAGLNLGVVVGATLSVRSEPSRGRMSLIDLSGLAGTVGGFALGQAFDSSDERLAHFALVGMATGLISGTWLTRNTDEPKTTLRPAVATTPSGDGIAFTLSGALPE